MLNGRIYTYGAGTSFTQRILGTFVFLIIIAACFYLFYHIYRILFYASPLFILAALIINPKIVSNHLKMIKQSFLQSFLGGLFEVGLQVIGLPIVSIGLVIKAWAYKKFGQLKNEMETQSSTSHNQYTTYEEVNEPTPTLSSSNTTDSKSKASNNYDDLFE